MIWLYCLYAFWLGSLVMFLMVWSTDKLQERRIKEMAEKVCAKDETVLCYNATLFINEKKIVSWFDNDKI